MARDFQINGECLAYVKGHGALADGNYPGVWELGLAQEEVAIKPKFNHYDIKIDSYGPSVPAETLWDLVEIDIEMSLIHYDLDVLNGCLTESMAGGSAFGKFASAGDSMGHGKALYTSGNHYIGLLLSSPVLAFPWYFPACYLVEPFSWPLGAKRTEVTINWRAIPYNPIPAAPPVPRTIAPLQFQSRMVRIGSGPDTAEMKSKGMKIFQKSSFSAFAIDTATGAVGAQIPGIY